MKKMRDRFGIDERITVKVVKNGIEKEDVYDCVENIKNKLIEIANMLEVLRDAVDRIRKDKD